MTTDRRLRVSDAERQVAAEQLRAAMADGRLDLLEYDNRIALAYRAVTYGDLEGLFTDLPGSRPAPVARPAPVTAVLDHGTVADMHLALKILWTIWGGAVVINLTVWLLLSLGEADLVYFWPMWMAVPGVVLLGATVGVAAIQRDRAEQRRRRAT